MNLLYNLSNGLVMTMSNTSPTYIPANAASFIGGGVGRGRSRVRFLTPRYSSCSLCLLPYKSTMNTAASFLQVPKPTNQKKAPISSSSITSSRGGTAVGITCGPKTLENCSNNHHYRIIHRENLIIKKKSSITSPIKQNGMFMSKSKIRNTNYSTRYSTRLYFSSKDQQQEQKRGQKDTTETSSDVPSLEMIQNYLLTNTNDNNNDDNPSIPQILLHTIQILQTNHAPEPIQSACHLIATVLQDDFQWKDNGFSKLMQFIQEDETTTTPNIRINTKAALLFEYDYLKTKQMTNSEMIQLSQYIRRRIQKEPLQYILGQWDFYQENVVLKIREPCLCPRPETEELVDYVAKDIRYMIQQQKQSNTTNLRKIRILDVGCGTGAIGITLAKLFPNQVEVVAIDVLKDAIELSQENAINILNNKENDDDDGASSDGNNMKKEEGQNSYQALLYSALDYTNTNKSRDNEQPLKFEFDVIVSNPPYIPLGDMTTLTEDVVDFEDYGALCGGQDGMDVIRDIVHRLPEWTSSSGKEEYDVTPICWMEVDTSHPALMEKWLRSSCDDKDIINQSDGVKGVEGSNANTKRRVQFECGKNDLSGLDRFVKLKII